MILHIIKLLTVQHHHWQLSRHLHLHRYGQMYINKHIFMEYLSNFPLRHLKIILWHERKLVYPWQHFITKFFSYIIISKGQSWFLVILVLLEYIICTSWLCKLVQLGTLQFIYVYSEPLPQRLVNIRFVYIRLVNVWASVIVQHMLTC